MDMQGQVKQRIARNLKQDVRGDQYRHVMTISILYSATLYFVVRPELDLNERAKGVLSQLRPHLIVSESVSRWPGTVLLAGEATCLQYHLTEDVAQFLCSVTDGLYDWRQPDLPEDIGFRRTDGSLWMATIAHEQDGFFELSDQELERLVDQLPWIRSYLELDE